MYLGTPCLWYLKLDVKHFQMNLLHGHGNVVFEYFWKKKRQEIETGQSEGSVKSSKLYHIFQINVFVFVTISLFSVQLISVSI